MDLTVRCPAWTPNGLRQLPHSFKDTDREMEVVTTGPQHWWVAYARQPIKTGDDSAGTKCSVRERSILTNQFQQPEMNSVP